MASDPMSDARLEEIRQKARLGIVSADTVVELLAEVKRLRDHFPCPLENLPTPPLAAVRPATSPETCPTCHAIRIEYPRCVNPDHWWHVIPERIEYPRCVNPDHSAQGHWRGHGILRAECQPCSDPFHSRAK